MVRRFFRLIVTAVLSVTVVAGVAWGALALWFDGPSSRVLAGTMCVAIGFTSLLLACAVIRRRFPVGVSPTRRRLQPEATGATVEVTKRLKPSVKRATKYGGSASVQAVTQVNAEQASKRTMRGPTRLPYRGRLIRLGKRADEAPSRCAGVVATACTQGKRTQHGRPQGVVWRTNRTPARDGPGALGCRRGS
jgi:hypothetical protein